MDKNEDEGPEGDQGDEELGADVEGAAAEDAAVEEENGEFDEAQSEVLEEVVG